MICRCAVTATHQLEDQAWIVGGHYTIGLSPGSDGWLIESITLTKAFVHGDAALPERARERTSALAGSHR